MGARPRWYRAAAWSSRARNTGEGRPLYCAAPSTAIASALVASSRDAARAAATTTAPQPNASSTKTTPAATSRPRIVGLPQPEERLAAQLPVRMRAGDANERGHTVAVGLL